MAEDSYLDSSGYPIKNPNVELDLPNPNPKDTGVDINVSSSQAPAPDDTQNVDTTPDNMQNAPMGKEDITPKDTYDINQTSPAEVSFKAGISTKNPFGAYNMDLEKEDAVIFQILADIRKKLGISIAEKQTPTQIDVSAYDDGIKNLVYGEYYEVAEKDGTFTMYSWGEGPYAAEIRQKEGEIGVAPDNPFEDITAEDDDLYESTGGLYLNQQEYYNHLIQKTMQIRNQQVNRILKNFIEHDVVPTAQQLNYYNISDFITETIRSNTGKRLDVEVTKTIVRDIKDPKFFGYRWGIEWQASTDTYKTEANQALFPEKYADDFPRDEEFKTSYGKSFVGQRLTDLGYDINSDEDIISALSYEFDKYYGNFIGEDAVDIKPEFSGPDIGKYNEEGIFEPGKGVYIGADWFKGTLWDDVFDADQKGIYLTLISNLNEIIENNDDIDEDAGKEIMLNYARAILTLDDDAFDKTIKDIDEAQYANAASLIGLTRGPGPAGIGLGLMVLGQADFTEGITDKPLVDLLEQLFSGGEAWENMSNKEKEAWGNSSDPSKVFWHAYHTDFDRYADISWGESEELDAIRRVRGGFADIDWDSTEGQDMLAMLLDISGGDGRKALRYKEYLSDPKLNEHNLQKNMAAWHAIRDTFRHWTSAEGIGTLAFLMNQRSLYARALTYLAPLWGGAFAEPTPFGEVAASVITAGVMAYMGFSAISQSWDMYKDVKADYENGATSEYDLTYHSMQSLINMVIGGLMFKHGATTPIRYQKFRGRDGKTYVLPTGMSAWEGTLRLFKPDYRLKPGGDLINSNFNNYIRRINAGEFKNFKEFDKAWHADPNIPRRLKGKYSSTQVYENAKVFHMMGYGWDNLLVDVSKITNKNVENSVINVIEKQSKSNKAENNLKEVNKKINENKAKIEETEIKIQEGSKKSGLSGVKENLANKKTLKDLLKEQKELKEKFDLADREFSVEKQNNLSIDKFNENVGDVILWSDFTTNLRDWAYIRIGKDGKVYRGELPEGAEPGVAPDGSVIYNYYSIKGSGHQGIGKGDSPMNSIVEISTGKNVGVNNHPALNNIAFFNTMRPRVGDKAGANGEYVYTGAKFGWRNMMDDGIIGWDTKSGAETVRAWHESLWRRDKSMFEGPTMTQYYAGMLKNWYNKYSRKITDDVSSVNKYKQFKGADKSDKIFTSEPNKHLWEIGDKVTLEMQKNGITVGDNFKIVDGTETWLKDLEVVVLDRLSSKNLKHRPNDPEVKMAYEAFMKENQLIMDILAENGYKIEIWKGKGEPYKNPSEMVADVANNKHLWVLSTKNAFGPTWKGENITVREFYDGQFGKGWYSRNVSKKKQVLEGNKKILDKDGNFNEILLKDFPLLRESGVKGFTHNDVFRAVHDLMHHAKSGNGFGKLGELQASFDGMGLYSHYGQLAFFNEAHIQNTYYNATGKFAPQATNIFPQLTKQFKTKGMPTGGSLPTTPIENTAPHVSTNVLKSFIKQSKVDNVDFAGGKWGVLANEITDVSGILFVIEKLGKNDIKLNGVSLKKRLKEIQKMSKEELAESNLKFLEEFIVQEGLKGNEIHMTKTHSVYGGKAESGYFLSGEISATQLQTLGLFLGQKSHLTNHGEFFNYTNQINNMKFSVTDVPPVNKTTPYTKIYTSDGGYLYLLGKDSKSMSYGGKKESYTNIGEHIELYRPNEPPSTMYFTSQKDVAMWQETFGSKGKLNTDPLPEEINLRNQVRSNIENIVREDGYLYIDWQNINDPHNLSMMHLMYNKNKSMTFRYVNPENGKMIETKIKYVIEKQGEIPAGFAESEVYVPNRKDLDKINSVDNEAILDGFNKKIITVEEIPIVADSPIPPNKGLDVNHIGNINLAKFPEHLRGPLQEVINEIGAPGWKSRVGYRTTHQDMYVTALEPANFQYVLERILIDGKKGGIFKKDGSVNENIRVNHTDVLSSQLLLRELIHRYEVGDAQVKTQIAPLIKKTALATDVIRRASGQSLNAMKIEINGETINIDNLGFLKSGEAEAIYNIFSHGKDPATILQKLVEIRRNWLLTSPGSLVRSTVGNTSSLLLEMTNMQISGMLNEGLTAFDYGIRSGNWNPMKNNTYYDLISFTEGFFRTKGVPNLMKDILLGKESAIAESSIARNEGWYSVPKTNVFVTTPQRLQILLDAIIRKPSENGFLYQMAHKKAISEGLKGNSYQLRVEELVKNPTKEMIIEAKTRAEFITFQAELGHWGRQFNRIRTGQGTEAVQLVVPFFNTSVNLMKRGYNLTPLGIGTYKYFDAVRQGFEHGHWGKFSDHTSRMAVGTSILYLLYQALGEGQYSWEGSWEDLDKEQRELKTNLGYQENSINWEDPDGNIKSFSTSGYEPLNVLFNIAGTWKNNEDDDIIEKSIKVMQTWISAGQKNPFMQGTSDLTELVMGDKDFVDYSTKMMVSTFVPNFILQGGKIKDDLKYESHYDEEWSQRVFNLDNWYHSLLEEFRFIESDVNVPKVDIFGEAVRVPDPVGATYGIRITKGGDDPVYNEITEELLRLYEGLGSLSFDISDYRGVIELSDKQAFLLEVAAGRSFYNQLVAAMTEDFVLDENGIPASDGTFFLKESANGLTENWKNMPDMAKIQTIKTYLNTIKESQLFAIAPELFARGQGGDWELLDPKDFVIYKEGDKSKGFETRDNIREILTDRYRASDAGALEVDKAEQAANEVITLMRQGENKDEAIRKVLLKLINNNKE